MRQSGGTDVSYFQFKSILVVPNFTSVCIVVDVNDVTVINKNSNNLRFVQNCI